LAGPVFPEPYKQIRNGRVMQEVGTVERIPDVDATINVAGTDQE
jgi:hypothetical protein